MGLAFALPLNLELALGTGPPLSNSWIINVIWLYIARNRTPYMSYMLLGGAVPKVCHNLVLSAVQLELLCTSTESSGLRT